MMMQNSQNHMGQYSANQNNQPNLINGLDERNPNSASLSARTSASQLLNLSPKDNKFSMTNYNTQTPSSGEFVSGTTRRPPA